MKKSLKNSRFNRSANIRLQRRSGKQAFAAAISPPLLRLCPPKAEIRVAPSEYLLIVATGQLVYEGGATATEALSLY